MVRVPVALDGEGKQAGQDWAGSASRDGRLRDGGALQTLKRRPRERVAGGDSLRDARITLKPINPEFDPIVVSRGEDRELTVGTKLVAVVPSCRRTMRLTVE